MVVRATQINPEMLRWARERSGYTIDDIARRRRVSPERVLQWEAGKSFPTWRQLEQLAYQDYHRGTVFFFLNNPPHEKTVADEFPRLPGAMLADLHPDTLYAVRQARIRQEDLAELLGPDGSSSRYILKELSGVVDDGNPARLADTVREYLAAGWGGPESWHRYSDAFRQWRHRIEDAGVWVFKRSFRQKDVAGFCLGDDAYPVIYINHGAGQARQIYTLFSGLAHLLFGFNYLERSDEQHYLGTLSGDDAVISAAAGRLARILRDEYEPAVQNWPVTEEDAASKATELKGHSSDRYCAVQAENLGQKYLRAAFLAYEAGQIDEFDLSTYLGVKGRHLDGLEHYVWQ